MRPAIRIVRLTAASVLLGALGACAVGVEHDPGAGEGAAAASDESLVAKAPVRCARGYYPNTLTVNPPCVPRSIRWGTGSPDPYTPDAPEDVCGSYLVPVPSGLPASCSVGVEINGIPFWSCPADTVVPPTLGAVSTTDGQCLNAPSDGQSLLLNGRTCELTQVLTSIHSKCVGSPVAGYVLVADGIFDEGCALCTTPPCNGGCNGQCARPRWPF